MSSWRTLFRSLVVALALVVGAPATAQASHQLGGTISWQRETALPFGFPSSTKARFVVQAELAFRWSFDWPTVGRFPPIGTVIQEELQVVDATGQAQELPISLTVRSTFTGRNPPPDLVHPDDWMIANGTVTIDLPLSGLPAIARFEGCCRNSTLADGNLDRDFRIDAVLTNVGAVTRSPATTLSPRLYTTVGESLDFLVPHVDFDNLPGRFRLALPAESGLVTPAPAGFTITPAGRVTWLPAAVGLYAVQLALENESGAKVPVDFVIEVGPPVPHVAFAPGLCGSSVPSYTGLETELVVDAVSPVPNDPVTIAWTPLPPGAAVTSQGPPWTFRWVPLLGQSSMTMCFTAASASGLTSIGNCCVDLPIMDAAPPSTCPPEAASLAYGTIPVGPVPTTLATGTTGSIELQVRNACDQDVTTTGLGPRFKVGMTNGSVAAPVALLDLGAGRYRIDFTPPFSGLWRLNSRMTVPIQNTTVDVVTAGSPFYFRVEPGVGTPCTDGSECPSGFCDVDACALDTVAPTVHLEHLPTITPLSMLLVAAFAEDEGELVSASLILNGTPMPGPNGPVGGGVAQFPPVALLEGDNTVVVQFVDKAGNVGGSTVVVTRDTIAPLTTFVSPTPDQAIGNAWVDVGLDVSDATLTFVRVNGGPPLPVPPGGGLVSTTVPVASSGPFTLTATSTDAAGNSSTTTRTVLVDLTAPDLTLDVIDGSRRGPLPGHLLPLVATVTALSATSVTTPSGTFTLPRGGGSFATAVPLVEGVNSIAVAATDETGRTSEVHRSVIYDLTPPIGAILAPAGGAFARGVVELAASFAPDLTDISSASFRVDGGAPMPASFDASGALLSLDTTALVDGPHALELRATDGVGNTGLAGSTFVVDNTPPLSSVLSPSGLVHGVIDVTVQAGDATSGVASLSVLVNGGAIATCDGALVCSAPFDTTALTDGPFVVSARASDRAGNVSTSPDTSLVAENAVASGFLVSPLEGAILRGSTLVVRVETGTASFQSGECFLDDTSIGTFMTATFQRSVSVAGFLDGLSTVRCSVRSRSGSLSTESVSVTIDRWSVSVTPTRLDLRPRHGCGADDVSVVVQGPNAELLLPVGPRRLALAVPGGAPVPVESGTRLGSSGKVRLEFDRDGLVASLRAGIAGHFIDPNRPVPVSLISASRVIGTDTVLLTR